jgi:hypothetical protein
VLQAVSDLRALGVQPAHALQAKGVAAVQATLIVLLDKWVNFNGNLQLRLFPGFSSIVIALKA